MYYEFISLRLINHNKYFFDLVAGCGHEWSEVAKSG